MKRTFEEILREALSLSKRDRAELAERLVESLDTAKEESFRRLWITEALRRREEVLSGRVQTVTGDEALASVRRAVGF